MINSFINSKKLMKLKLRKKILTSMDRITHSGGWEPSSIDYCKHLLYFSQELAAQLHILHSKMEDQDGSIKICYNP
jgi:hypothetical protein